MNVVVTGATGMVGGLALGLLLDDPRVDGVITMGRRTTGRRHKKLTEIEHADFTEVRQVGEHLTGVDAALYCLGAYTGAVPDDEFRRITVDFTVGFAEELRAQSPSAAFCFLSGQGADRKEKSRIPFARHKGAAENALIAAGFPRLHIFRPGYIYPVAPREEPNLSYRIMRTLWPAARRIYPNLGVASDHLARAMAEAALEGTPGHQSDMLENRDIRRAAARTANPTLV